MTDERKAPEIEEADFITLEFDDGVDVYIYGYKEIGDDEFELVDIEDDDEFEKVVAEFDKIMEE